MYTNIAERVGHTPLTEVPRFAERVGIAARLCVKAEMYNPAGSVKDRAALYMLRDAMATGKLRSGGMVVEPTSGNTGIALAALCASLGYRAVLVMPRNMSVERRRLMQAYGAEVVLTDGGMRECRAVAEKFARETGAYMPDQFRNPASVTAHLETTAPEIWRDTGGKVDVFVAGVGSGGTITGVGKYLRARNPRVHIVAVEPSDSPVLQGGAAGPHGLQGIGAGFVPPVLDTTVYDEAIGVTTEQAFAAARTLARTEGIAAGISSGAALYAAALVASRDALPPRATIVVLLPDGADRYLSAALYADDGKTGALR